MNQYKLLTPGPLTTTETIKETMLLDRCTWDDDYKSITQDIRSRLLKIAQVDASTHTTILMQGSGSFVVESILHTTIRKTDTLLVITNGAYGKRIVEMAKRIGINTKVMDVSLSEAPDIHTLETTLQNNPEITHVAVVHCETTTGILNPIEDISKVVKAHNKIFIVDAMSSFGGVEMDINALQIDYLVSSANKCIQGVPGFGFVIAKLEPFEKTEGNSMSLSLDLYDQWLTMNVDGKWRYTSPTHVVAAFRQALLELDNEGGVTARTKRYYENNRYLRNALEQLGFKAYIQEDLQSPIITTYLYPNKDFSFPDFYEAMKQHGFVLYPGKLMDEDSFRIGNIGDIHKADFERLVQHITDYMEVK